MSSSLFSAEPRAIVYSCILTNKHFYEGSIERLYRQLNIKIVCGDGRKGTAVVGVKPGKLVKCMEASDRVAARAGLAATVTLAHEEVFGVEYGDGTVVDVLPKPITWPAIPYADLAKWISQHMSPVAFHFTTFGGSANLSAQVLASLPVDRLQDALYRSVLEGEPMGAFIALICRAASTLQSISLPGSKPAGFPAAVPSFPQLRDLTLSPDIDVPFDQICRMIEQAPRLQQVLWVKRGFLAPKGKPATQRRLEAFCRQRGIKVGAA